MKLKNISEVYECPHCKSNFGYYQKSFVSGWIQDTTLFEKDRFTGDREKYNSEMYDSLISGKYNPTCYCSECDNPIGTNPKIKT